jgi:NADPH-dependent ferric siderophore reductase
MVRLTLAGAELAGFNRTGAAGHVRVWIPNASGELVHPGSIAEGVDVPPDRRSPTRVYTPRSFRPEQLELDLDVVLHGVGPLSTWAAAARPGDPVVIAGPGGVYTPDPDADWYLLAGDETAIPAIGTVLETIAPNVEIAVLLEVADAIDEQPLPAHPGARVRWLHRGEGRPGSTLSEAIRSVDVPRTGAARVWIAGEAAAIRVMRRDLLSRAAIEPSSLHTRGYWKLGESNHPDHDFGLD